MTDTLKNDDGSSSYSVPETKQRTSGPEMSEAIPFLARPKVLTKELAGDFGFDPLHLAKDRDTLWYYREIEIKHARLAMLVGNSKTFEEGVFNFLNGISFPHQHINLHSCIYLY
jgi:Chlorophyll A-B binding protein